MADKIGIESEVSRALKWKKVTGDFVWRAQDTRPRFSNDRSLGWVK
jgi:hypothetical protein